MTVCSRMRGETYPKGTAPATTVSARPVATVLLADENLPRRTP